MLFIMLATLILAVLWAGVGFVFFTPQPGRALPFRTLLNRFWVGWALVIAFLQIWHLIFPVGAVAFAVIVAASLAGWFRVRTVVLAQAKTWGILRILVVGALAAIPLVILSSQVLNSSPNYDHGLYHVQTVRWLSQYAIVPGLGNLHHRLAFNNSNLLYVAAINWGPFTDRAYYLANLLPAFVLILACADGFYRLFQSEQRWRASNVYYAWMLPVALWQFSTQTFSGYSPDVMVFILQVVIGAALLSLAESENQPQALHRLKFLTLLAVVGITVKLSFMIFGLVTILAALIYLQIRFGWVLKRDSRQLMTLAGLGALLLVPWMVRSVILSGYLLFPSMVISFPVAWRVPDALVEPIAPIITNWARTMSNSIPYTADLAWFRRWWQLFPFPPVQRAFQLSLGLLLANLGLAFFLRKKTQLPAGAMMLFAICACSMVFWFMMGPDYRFSGAIFWMLLFANLLFAAHLLTESNLVQPVMLVSAILVVLAIWLNPAQFIIRRPPANQIFYPAPENEVMAERFQIGPFETRQTTSGLSVNMPLEPNDQCWYADLPCTRPQDFITSLRLIDPSDMQKGFMIQK